MADGVRTETGRARRPRAPVRAFAAALVAGDTEAARECAHRHLEATGSRLAVISDLFHPAQYQVGELWYQGHLGVAEEHRATAIVTRIAMSLPPTPVAHPVAGAGCILAGLPREQHVVGLQLLAMALEDEGWAVNQLPPPTPLSELLRAIGEWRPAVVGLSAAFLPTARQITTAVEAIRARGVPVLVGGPLFNRAPDLWRVVGADAHGSDARVATVLMRKLVRH